MTTASPHNLTTGDQIEFDNNSLIFKCSQDNYLTEHKYPRATDPSNWGSASDELGVDIVDAVGTSKTFSVYAGVSTSGGLVGPLQMEFICSILENSTAS